MRNIVLMKVLRFVMNFVFFCAILGATTFYAYTNNADPAIFNLKNTLVPLKGVLFLDVILSIIMAGFNEISTLILLKIGKRKNG